MGSIQARVTVVDYLKERGLFRGTTPNPMRLGICSRSKDVIEPMLKPQWWVACKGMADEACSAVRDGRLRLVPRDSEATWFRWLENIRDWCISRQLWWGHRIPAYYVSLKDDPDAGAPGLPTERMDRWVVAADIETATALAAERFGDHHKFELLQVWEQLVLGCVDGVGVCGEVGSGLCAAATSAAVTLPP